MNFLIISFLWLSTLSSVYAREWKTSKYYNTGKGEFYTCNQIRTKAGLKFDYTFKPSADKPYAKIYNVVCEYPPAIGTMLKCMTKYADMENLSYETMFNAYVSVCDIYSTESQSLEFYKAQYENSTQFNIPIKSVNTSLPIYAPVNLNTEASYQKILGYQKFYWNLDSGTWFSAGICLYFLLVIIIGSIHNFCRKSGIIKTINKSFISKKIQSYITLPTLIPNGKYADDYTLKLPFTNITVFTILFPNRMQFLVDVGLFVLQVAFLSIPYGQNVGTLFSTSKIAWTRGVADRSGIMSFGKIPLLILFAGRNNFLMWITGWSYTTFLHYHKIVSMWMASDALIHSVAYTILELKNYREALKEQYFAAGVALTVVCFVMCGFAVREIRRRWYNWFLLGHIAMGIAFMVLAWYHCKDLGWCEWLFAAWVIWFTDRLVRVIRMTLFGWKRADVSIIHKQGDEQVFKVKVTKPKFWESKPGQFGYLYFGGLTFWKNNPFTIIQQGDNLIIYIKVKDGVTESIYKKLLKAGGSCEWRVCIEGPYGTKSSPHKFESQLLIAGGVGASGIIDTASKIGSETKSSQKLVWVIRDRNMFDAYGEIMQNIKIPTDVYITRAQEPCTGSSDSSSSSKKESSSFTSEYSNIFTFHYGRPDLDELLNENIKFLGSSVAIVGCGPPVMMDMVRNSVARGVNHWGKSVEFFDELQVW
ncbi:ferric-chelate reductase [Martiniozyma asiatica (nom. inval.)]|nr:ferric-chelate reductase [Martiniozyma asiatica]